MNDAIRPVLASLGGGGPVENGGVQVASGPAPDSPVLTMKVPAADSKVVDELKKLNLLVLPLSKEQNQLEVSAVNAHTFNDAQAAELPKLSNQIVWLKLGDTEISDAALASGRQVEKPAKTPSGRNESDRHGPETTKRLG